MYPIEVNKADYYSLLKVPGIGVLSAKKIISTRKNVKIDFEVLKKLGVVLKRSKYFILCDGVYYTKSNLFNKSFIESELIERKNVFKQLNLFGGD